MCRISKIYVQKKYSGRGRKCANPVHSIYYIQELRTIFFQGVFKTLLTKYLLHELLILYIQELRTISCFILLTLYNLRKCANPVYRKLSRNEFGAIMDIEQLNYSFNRRIIVRCQEV
jgi:hypothetical protein